MRLRLLPREPFAGLGYVWLVYLASPIGYACLASPRTTAMTVETAAAVLVFLPLYFRGYWVTGASAFLPIAGITAIAVGLTAVNAGGPVFFIYAAAFAFRTGPPPTSVPVLGAIAAVAALDTLLGGMTPFASEWAWWAIVMTVVIGGVVIYSNEAGRRLRASQDDARHLAVVAERERIGRDLHDVLGHTLSVIAIKAELASKLATRDLPRALAEIADVERISREALSEVRQAVVAGRHALLADEIRNARIALDAAGVVFECDVEPIALPRACEQALALALREGVTNVVRHAGARRCLVTIGRVDDDVRLEVFDDGRGGDVREGSGLAGMRTRIAALGGRVERDGANGMRVCVTLPAVPVEIPTAEEPVA